LAGTSYKMDRIDRTSPLVLCYSHIGLELSTDVMAHDDSNEFTVGLGIVWKGWQNDLASCRPEGCIIRDLLNFKCLKFSFLLGNDYYIYFILKL